MSPDGPEHLRIRTEQIAVRIFTNDFVIEGEIHTKPGGYSSRVTDVLNLSKHPFMPLTNVRYRVRTGTPSEFVRTPCLIIRVDNIEVIDLINGE